MCCTYGKKVEVIISMHVRFWSTHNTGNVVPYLYDILQSRTLHHTVHVELPVGTYIIMMYRSGSLPFLRQMSEGFDWGSGCQKIFQERDTTTYSRILTGSLVDLADLLVLFFQRIQSINPLLGYGR